MPAKKGSQSPPATPSVSPGAGEHHQKRRPPPADPRRPGRFLGTSFALLSNGKAKRGGVFVNSEGQRTQGGVHALLVARGLTVPTPYLTGCRECGQQLQVVYLCVYCAQPFCSQACFHRHVVQHVDQPDTSPADGDPSSREPPGEISAGSRGPHRAGPNGKNGVGPRVPSRGKRS